jgi:hypothetical protein
MDRPLIYGDSYVVNRNMPYEMIEALPSGAHRGGGVLGKGKGYGCSTSLKRRLTTMLYLFMWKT